MYLLVNKYIINIRLYVAEVYNNKITFLYFKNTHMVNNKLGYKWSNESNPEIFHSEKVITNPDTWNETILIVDDEESLRKFLKTALESLNYNVLTAINWQDWLEKFLEYINIIDLIILDLSMPIMTWDVLFQKMFDVKKDVRVIISSGYCFNTSWDSVLSNAKWFLNKPYTIKTLSDKLNEVLSEWK